MTDLKQIVEIGAIIYTGINTIGYFETIKSIDKIKNEKGNLFANSYSKEILDLELGISDKIFFSDKLAARSYLLLNETNKQPVFRRNIRKFLIGSALAGLIGLGCVVDNNVKQGLKQAKEYDENTPRISASQMDSLLKDDNYDYYEFDYDNDGNIDFVWKDDQSGKIILNRNNGKGGVDSMVVTPEIRRTIDDKIKEYRFEVYQGKNSGFL